MKNELLVYLRKKPQATLLNIQSEGFGTIIKNYYDNSINLAKRKAGVPEKYIREAHGGINNKN